MRGRELPPTVRQRRAEVRQRLQIRQPQPNYKLRAGLGFVSCLCGLWVMESSTPLSLGLLALAGYLWVNGINGAASEWEGK
jgi:hypothetical protein